MGITISKYDNNIDIATNIDKLIVANNISGETVTVDAEQTSVVTVSNPGPKGDPYQYNSDDNLLVGQITASGPISSSYGFTGSLEGDSSEVIVHANASSGNKPLTYIVGQPSNTATSINAMTDYKLSYNPGTEILTSTIFSGTSGSFSDSRAWGQMHAAKITTFTQDNNYVFGGSQGYNGWIFKTSMECHAVGHKFTKYNIGSVTTSNPSGTTMYFEFIIPPGTSVKSTQLWGNWGGVYDMYLLSPCGSAISIIEEVDVNASGCWTAGGDGWTEEKFDLSPLQSATFVGGEANHLLMVLNLPTEKGINGAAIYVTEVEELH